MSTWEHQMQYQFNKIHLVFPLLSVKISLKILRQVQTCFHVKSQEKMCALIAIFHVQNLVYWISTSELIPMNDLFHVPRVKLLSKLKAIYTSIVDPEPILLKLNQTLIVPVQRYWMN